MFCSTLTEISIWLERASHKEIFKKFAVSSRSATAESKKLSTSLKRSSTPKRMVRASTRRFLTNSRWLNFLPVSRSGPKPRSTPARARSTTRSSSRFFCLTWVLNGRCKMPNSRHDLIKKLVSLQLLRILVRKRAYLVAVATVPFNCSDRRRVTMFDYLEISGAFNLHCGQVST